MRKRMKVRREVSVVSSQFLYLTTGSFLFPVAKDLTIAPKFRVLVTFYAFRQLTRYGPFDKLSFRRFIVTFFGLQRDIIKTKYLALNHGHKIHIPSLQCSSVSAWILRDLRMVLSDSACFSVSKTPPELNVLEFQSRENASELG